MDEIRFIVPGEPVPKGRPRLGRYTTYTPALTRKAEAAVAAIARQAMAGRDPLDGPLCLSVIAHMPIPQSWSKRKRAQAEAGELAPVSRPDLDNIVKLVTDAINAIVYKDDSQVVALCARKVYGVNPMVEVVVGREHGRP